VDEYPPVGLERTNRIWREEERIWKKKRTTRVGHGKIKLKKRKTFGNPIGKAWGEKKKKK